MRVFFFWEPVGGLSLEHRCNPYAGLLARALERRGVHLQLGEYAFEAGWLEQNRREYEVLHLHWLHHFYRRGSLEETADRYAHFAENLHLARRLGYRIVWTMHNLYPHERPFPQMDRLARLLVCRLADALIAHCEHAAALAKKLFFWERRVHAIPHGNFIDAFANEVPREKARQKLGIDGRAFVYLFFGNARNYKGIEDLIAAFNEVADRDALLVLMMRQAFNPAYAAELEAMAGGNERIRVFTSDYFPNEEFQYFLNSADVSVLPFSEVLTSGSAITSLSFGRPVILPARGCLPELIDESMGLLYDPGEQRGLHRALVRIRERDLEAAGRAAFERAEALDWEEIAGRTARVYEKT